MPRYQAMVEPTSEVQPEAALCEIEDRYPEVTVEAFRWAGPGAVERTTAVICRAPSETHVRRCLDAAGLRARSVQRF